MNINQAQQYINQNIGFFVFIDNGGASNKIKQHFERYGNDIIRSIFKGKGGLLVKGKDFNDSQFNQIAKKVGAKTGFLSGYKFPIIVANGKTMNENDFLRMN